jgi:hypothetical protein
MRCSDCPEGATHTQPRVKPGNCIRFRRSEERRILPDDMGTRRCTESRGVLASRRNLCGVPRWAPKGSTLDVSNDSPGALAAPRPGGPADDLVGLSRRHQPD